MENEYVIINKTKLLKRIEELKKLQSSTDRIIYADKYYAKEVELKEILSQSIPLIPEIEKAYDAGVLHKELSLSFDNPKGRYISNLNLEI